MKNSTFSISLNSWDASTSLAIFALAHNICGVLFAAKSLQLGYDQRDGIINTMYRADILRNYFF